MEALKRSVSVGVGGAGERLGIAGWPPARPRCEARSPPSGQSVDLGRGDARPARRLVVQVEAVGTIVELRNPQAQELGEAASIRRSALYPNASAPIRAMISASFPLASSRRFAAWRSSDISVPFALIALPACPLSSPRESIESSWPEKRAVPRESTIATPCSQGTGRWCRAR